MKAILFGAMLALALPAQAQDEELKALTQCSYGPALKAQSVTRRGGGPGVRVVETVQGPREVSVADGYRVMLAYPHNDPFVNLKIERSAPGQANIDRETILAQMHGMVLKTQLLQPPTLKLDKQRGIELIALDGGSLNGSVLGIYTLVDKARDLVLTAYLLNQKPEARSFQSVQEYALQRDAFLAGLIDCLAPPKAAAAPAPRRS